jgi:hypothetical protein
MLAEMSRLSNYPERLVACVRGSLFISCVTHPTTCIALNVSIFSSYSTISSELKDLRDQWITKRILYQYFSKSMPIIASEFCHYLVL